MKKVTALIAVLFLMTLGFISCGKSGGPKAGTAKGDDILELLPAEADGVFFLDMKRAMEAEFIQKAIAEDEKVQDIIQKTGIDPAQDIFYLAGAFTQKTDDDANESVAVLVNMKFDRDQLLAFIREKVAEEGQEVTETSFEEFTLYNMWTEGKEACFAFIDESNMAIGNPGQVQSVIEVIQKKRDNVFKNAALADLISQTDRQALLWGAINFKRETLDKMTADNPMFQDLQGVQSASLVFDIKNQNYIAQIKLNGGDETSNKKIADFLTGIKALGAMISDEKPEVGDLLNSIEITSGAESVQISANISEETISKLQQDMKSTEGTGAEEIK